MYNVKSDFINRGYELEFLLINVDQICLKKIACKKYVYKSGKLK